MINLAGNKVADSYIKEELYLANIPAVQIEPENGEVPYTIIGKIGNWTFKRGWSYWITWCENEELGLVLKDALELHNKKNPINNDILGNVIRCGGHAGCPSPDEYGAQPIYDYKLDKKLESLGYKKQYDAFLDKEYIPISVGEISELCNKGKLIIERYVVSYHIDTQIGLTEFAKFLKEKQ